MYAAAEHAGLVIKEQEQFVLGHAQRFEHQITGEPVTTRQQPYKQLWAIVVNAGYPTALADALFENVRPAEVARMSGLTSPVVSNLIKRLPSDLLHALAPLLPCVTNSWLQRELGRRCLTDPLRSSDRSE